MIVSNLISTKISALTLLTQSILCLATLYTPLSAQLNSGNFTQFTEKDGLPGIVVNDVLIDRLGYIWAGTANGLTQFDGYTFKRFYFNPNDTNTLQGLLIHSLFEDRKGQIWIGSSPSFLNVYDPVTQKFREYKFTGEVPHREGIQLNIQEICQDDNGRMYFGVATEYGDSISTALLYKNENEEQVKLFPIPSGLHVQNVYMLKKDNNGNVWVLSYSGVFKIDKEDNLSQLHIPLLENEMLRNNDWYADIIFDRQGHMWAITQELRLYDIDLETSTYKTWYSKELYRSLDFYWIPRKIVFDKDENIWMGTNGGVQFFNRKTGQFAMFTSGVKSELERIVINDLKFDSFGTLWVATGASGLMKYEEKTLLKSYSFYNNEKYTLTSGWANNIYEASDGKIWITTGGSEKTSGINILDLRTGDIRKITYPQIQNRVNGISAIWETRPDEIYLGVYNGIFKFDENTFELEPIFLPGLPDKPTINYHYTDTRGNEWLCTFSGIYKKEKGGVAYKQYDLRKLDGSNETSNGITRVFESKMHGLWLLTNNGLFLYTYATDKIERHGYDKNAGDIFVTQDINSLYEDADGIVWVGTWSGGLSTYNVETKMIKTYTRNEGLPSMSIQGILADDKNHNLWLSTYEGLSRLNLKTEQFNNFSIADGIQGQLFADGSYLKTSGGLFAFGGANGITIFNPDEVNKSSIPPKVFLTDFKLFNISILPGENSIFKNPIYETDEITLSHNQNNISLEFVALHFENPALNQYSYKLEGYDNDWRNVGNQRVAFYPNLPPGEYSFHVKAANDKGVWNEKGATLMITVNPPWWKTIQAYILYGILFLGLAFSVDRYFRRRVVQKERERSRTRDLEHAKEIEKAYYKLEEAHESLKATQAQLIHSEKMASLGELTAGIAHEIQNPLNFVNNFAEVNSELIAEMKHELDLGKPEDAKSIANSIDENEQKIIFHGKRADTIVKGMLMHSRSSSGVKEPTDINALCDEYLRLAYHGLRAKDKSFNATIKTDFDENIGLINIIPQDIGRVVLNLITNAFYAVTEKKKQGLLPTEGGYSYEPTVTVFTKVKGSPIAELSQKVEGKKVEALGDLGVKSAWANEAMVEIRVKDNGNGIPQQVLDKIFQPFFTTKPTGQGTGLGLSLSYDIIKAHGGELKVETKEGEFAEFIITLPIQ